MNSSIPPEWGKDSLSEFIETARHNMFATFVNCPSQYNTLKNIHDVYKYVIDNLINTPEWFVSFFLLKSHSAYLGGVRFSISGQCAEAYMVLRGSIEAALYGLYLSRDNNSRETWGHSLIHVERQVTSVPRRYYPLSVYDDKQT